MTPAPIPAKVRKQVALALVRAGNRLGMFDVEPECLHLVGRSGDARPTVGTELTVVLSRHAIERFGERTGRPMGPALQAAEIGRLWQHAVITVEPPDWCTPSVNSPGADLYATIADITFPLVVDEHCTNTFVATTVLSKLGARGAKRAGAKDRRTGRSGAKFKRRKHPDRKHTRSGEIAFDD